MLRQNVSMPLLEVGVARELSCCTQTPVRTAQLLLVGREGGRRTGEMLYAWVAGEAL